MIGRSSNKFQGNTTARSYNPNRIALESKTISGFNRGSPVRAMRDPSLKKSTYISSDRVNMGAVSRSRVNAGASRKYTGTGTRMSSKGRVSSNAIPRTFTTSTI